MCCEQAFAINPMRLVFPYFGVIVNLLQCCGLCSKLYHHFSCVSAHSIAEKAACDTCRTAIVNSCMCAIDV